MARDGGWGFDPCKRNAMMRDWMTAKEKKEGKEKERGKRDMRAVRMSYFNGKAARAGASYLGP